MLSKIQIQKTLDKTFVAISIKDDCHLIMCSDTMKHGRDNSYKGMIVMVSKVTLLLNGFSSNSYKGMIVINDEEINKYFRFCSNSYKGMIVI